MTDDTKINFTLISNEETNPYADVRFCHNGGGYFQPHLRYEGTVRSIPAILDIADTSCGEFGKRYVVGITLEGGSEKTYWFDDVNRNDDVREGSDIPQWLVDEIRFFCFEQGYPISSQEELENCEEEKWDENNDGDDWDD